MDRKRKDAMDDFAKGGAAMHIASRELELPMASVKVAGASGVGTAVEHVRAVKASKAAARKRQKAARRVNR